MDDHERDLANLSAGRLIRRKSAPVPLGPIPAIRAYCLLTAVVVLALGSWGCSDDLESLSRKGDYIVFGDFYGECLGEECVDFYKIVDGKLFEDTLDKYPFASELPHTLELVERPGGRYDEIVERIGDVPGDLFDEDRLVIGQPDAGDWGGFYLETNVSGIVRYWLIDKNEDNLPGYLLGYTRKLNEAIQIAAE